ncbi:MAG: signal peptide peptidase SppA [Candidatus Latescibacteria bacterium]|nr:signal peptide peptidase SppA [Candidatus Latescibacterota bacterium]NIM21372.1 signal peptide peptidase SppA [Candidatus Latescibacterota bacterium]NIM65553.1 signal peptide peptidase SppA [Candidatus Latescibacterota bacterium]NIO01933.1 signal peptide peptidase SppA [Candidatus Latescibacterota bacterium]NIO28746.1 signal peptide peptidase SppA [Candidatus Latescibacterota bacterium]
MPEKRNVAFIVLFSAAVLLTFLFFLFYFLMAFYLGDEELGIGEAVAVVDIHGEIRYDLSKIRELESYRDNKRVKAVLLHINSPGGGVAASQEIYHAVEKLRAKKPVVAFLAEIAASGGYYVACAADSVISLEGTLTGSIGVIAAFLNTEELFHKIGLGITVVKSGKYKDVGSPHREITEEERRYLETLLDRAYGQFLRAVSKGRGMELDEVKELAEGRLYSGEEAEEIGLVDRLGTYEEAIAVAASMGGIKNKPKIIRKRKRKHFFRSIFGEIGARIPVEAENRITLKYIIP